MKYFEEMEPQKREAMILRAAAFNVSLEGMEESKQRLLNEAARIQSKKINVILAKAGDQTDE